MVKTLRLPNDWSEAHWMLDYRFGFIKRGLGGEIFGWLFEKNEHTILILSAAILFLLYVFIFRIAVQETFKRQNNVPRILFFLIFFLSQYIVFSAHLIGYFDHIVFLLTILIIYLIKRKKIFWASFMATISIFIHEISFFLMLPISCFAVLVTVLQNERFSFRNVFSMQVLKKLAVFLLLPFIATISVAVYQEINNEDQLSQIYNYLTQIPFIAEKPADSVAAAYTKSFTYYFSEERSHFIQRLLVSTCTIFYGIPILFSLWMIFKEFKLKQNIRVFLLLAIVAFIPLLLHAIAYDTYRIWSFPFMILFLGFWILSSALNTDKENMGKPTTIEIILFLISLFMVSIIPNHLFDDETERISIVVRLIMVIPILLILYVLKNSIFFVNKVK
ncbi:hypothetical protein PFY12_00315 [Chryseobacterium camelliae]|uniref:DUF2029 domain-containing protein n=1 Tax=Chryseobacterium camelliae TaxID=1265445 RepID=A0ABY7QPB0_9FLAO|nr:hypothetical protein [Chryseobacterium camelliae]WBV60578.1 hypothetical protein PFY12_00315 [Chryseobacterium camelliae]